MSSDSSMSTSGPTTPCDTSVWTCCGVPVVATFATTPADTRHRHKAHKAERSEEHLGSGVERERRGVPAAGGGALTGSFLLDVPLATLQLGHDCCDEARDHHHLRDLRLRASSNVGHGPACLASDVALCMGQQGCNAAQCSCIECRLRVALIATDDVPCNAQRRHHDDELGVPHETHESSEDARCDYCLNDGAASERQSAQVNAS